MTGNTGHLCGMVSGTGMPGVGRDTESSYSLQAAAPSSESGNRQGQILPVFRKAKDEEKLEIESSSICVGALLNDSVIDHIPSDQNFQDG